MPSCLINVCYKLQRPAVLGNYFLVLFKKRSILNFGSFVLGLNLFETKTELKCSIYCLNIVLDCIMLSSVPAMKCEQI